MTPDTAAAHEPQPDLRPAHLMRTGIPVRPGGRSSGERASEVARGTVADLVAVVRADDGDELWRYTIVVGDDEYIRNADLRALVRSQD